MRRSIFAVTCMGILAGCATLPNGPSVAVMPAPGKPFDLFAAEERECRQFAQQSIGMSPNQAATDSAVKSAAVGTAIGAAAGALAGGHEGAGSGAAFGMLAGAAIGSNESQYSGNEAQRRYDIAYEQCMYAKGNQLPQAYPYQSRMIYSQPPAPSAPAYNSPPPTYNSPPPPPPPPMGQ
ncbi:MAG: YMGG-like glycine zipper-containing protein [Gallionellaceae bacterium]